MRAEKAKWEYGDGSHFPLRRQCAVEVYIRPAMRAAARTALPLAEEVRFASSSPLAFLDRAKAVLQEKRREPGWR